MALLSWYQSCLDTKTLQFDEDQQSAVLRLQRILDEWDQAEIETQAWWSWRKKPMAKRRGLYLYGGVGRGKTFLVDRFFHFVPSSKKGRWHFHVFMQQIHQALSLYQGQEDPLKAIALSWSKNYELLVFDEFFVSDITDAMLLGHLLRFLFELGVVMVFTSNISPSDLYRNGLQRARFLPAISAIENHCDVVCLIGDKDHREVLVNRQACFFTYEQKADFYQVVTAFFPIIAVDEMESINGRMMAIKGKNDSTLWVDFHALCVQPRHNTDYMVLANRYSYFLIQNVPVLTMDEESSARRFLSLVDECYEKRVSLIILAQVPLRDLYQGKALKFEFQRCLSRLEAMQSMDYVQS
jgi:cell division protein ZapE